MNEETKKTLLQRNKKIIEIIRETIEEKCPGTVDLIGIAGSFCNGDIYDKSDLDLVIIINDDKACLLNVCFILDDVGFDIYTCTWDRFESMSEYETPFVTKLFDLDIVYTKEESVLTRYSSLKEKLKENMSNSDKVNYRIGELLGDLISSNTILQNSNDTRTKYLNLAKIITYTEYIIYLLNRSYVKRGVKRIPEEISSMQIMPNGLLDLYLTLPFLQNTDENCSRIVDILTKYLNTEPIYVNKKRELIEKKEITSSDLTGTYEEIVSNWYNKMLHASQINSEYLSFMTMASCQEFYDEMFEIYDIPSLNLIGLYEPNDLNKNVASFTKILDEWKKLYDRFDKKVLTFRSLDEFHNHCKQNLK